MAIPDSSDPTLEMLLDAIEQTTPRGVSDMLHELSHSTNVGFVKALALKGVHALADFPETTRELKQAYYRCYLNQPK